MSKPMLTATAPTPLLDAISKEPLSDTDFCEKVYECIINGEIRDPDEIIRIIAQETNESEDTIREMYFRLIVKKEM